MVRNAIHKFNERGLREALRRDSHRQHIVSAREFGKDSTLWKMEMAVDVSFEEGLTKEQVFGLP
jgi:hypothetical protein